MIIRTRPSNRGLSKNHSNPDEWLEVTPGERFRIKVDAESTGGGYTALEFQMDHQNGTPRHIHLREDERFIVLEGTAQIVRGDTTAEATSGMTVTVKKGIPHAWYNVSGSPLHILTVFSPGGIEEMFCALARGGDINLQLLLERSGCPVVGPVPLEHLNTTGLLDQLDIPMR